MLPPTTRTFLSSGLLVGPLLLSAQAYFQQQVDHRIEVTLDDVRHELRAYQEIDYHNRSPQALDTLWLHLWPNAYQGAGTALCEQLEARNDFGLRFAPPGMRGGIDSLDFRCEGRPLRWGFHPRHGDIGWVALERPLAPGTSVTISTPFRVDIPSATISRLGRTGQAYYITQWYPKPAVYDRQGWHAMPYLDQGEFFSEFGSYDVSITLPDNYVVGATGELQNEEELRRMETLASDRTARAQAVMDQHTGRPSMAFPPSSPTTKTLRYVQDNVHDFAWFTDKRFIVARDVVHVPPSGRAVTTWALFTPKHASTWYAMGTTSLNASLVAYSSWVGEYPYNSCTAVDGTISAGGGMEYPMITIISDMDDPQDLDEVIAHEVGHNWFQGMLGSNEREHPWLDEGVNSFYERRYMEQRYPDTTRLHAYGLNVGFLTKGRGISFRRQQELTYRYNARRNMDAPLSSRSVDLTQTDYGTTIYAKGALVMDQLFHSLGQARFDSCMQHYFQEWRFKHPAPEDLLNTFGNPGFLQDLLSGKKIDAYAKGLRDNTARVAFRGGYFPAPVNTFPRSALEHTDWSSPNDDRHPRIHAVPLTSQVTTGYRIDAHERTIDIDRRNNGMRAKGLLRRTRLPELKFLAGIERDDRRSIYWSPALGVNAHDGWMPGLVLHNTTFPSQRLEWVAAPLFGTRSGRPAGGARIQWHHDRLRSGLLRNIHVGLSGSAASLWSVGEVEQWYQRLVPSLQLDLRGRPNSVRTNVQYRSIWLQHRAEGRAQGPVAMQGEWMHVDRTTDDLFHEVRLQAVRSNGLHPFQLQVIGLQHELFTRAALEAQWSAIYDRHKHRITFRGFAGTFLRNIGLRDPSMGWRMHWGSSDLLYDHLYFEREPLGQNSSIQFNKDQGGFKTPTAVGSTDRWIAALNMELDMPFLLPLSLFGSYGAAPYTTITSSGRTESVKGYWEVGLGLRVWRDMVEVWVPLAFSDAISQEQDLRDRTFGERIRIVFALEKMDPTQALRKLPN